ncbi:MAG: glycosyltransferase family 39 protein [Anaerolineae bacterium]|nr:glycosyltransferase family 39 protein [Anaerolineae bacterium]
MQMVSLQLVALLIGIACMIVAALWLHPDNKQDYLVQASIAMLVGLGALAVALRGVSIIPWRPALAVQVRRPRWRLIGLGAVLLAVLAENNALRFAPQSFDFMSYHVQFLLLAGGIALILIGLRDAPRGDRIDGGEWLLIAGIFVVALVPRIVALDTLVRSLVDELPWVDGIRNFWWRGDVELLRPMSSTFPFTSLFPYWEAGAVEIFGHNLIGLRIVSSVAGALTVVALYGLARHLFDRTTALLAAILLAFFPPHVHFSRLALLNMIDPLPGTLAFAWAVRGLRYNRRLDWALAGVALGATHYFFEAGRLLYTPLMVIWLGWLALTWRGEDGRNNLRPYLRSIGVLVLTTLLVALPVYYVFAAQGEALAGRLNQSAQSSDFLSNIITGTQPVDDLARQGITPLLMYVNQPESVAYYGGDQPLVLTGIVPLFLLGVAYVVLRARQPSIILVMTLLATAAGNTLLKDPAVSARYVVALPSIALLIALGLRVTVDQLIALYRSPMLAAALRILVPVAVVALCVVQMVYYFGPHIERFNEQNRYIKRYRDSVDAVLRAANLDENTYVVLIGEPVVDGNVPSHFLNFLRTDMTLQSITPQELTQRFLADLPTIRPYAFFVAQDDAHSVNLIREFFYLQPPEITPNYEEVPEDRQFVLYFAPLGSARDTARAKNIQLQIITPPADE